jgi:hypothetical protein
MTHGNNTRAIFVHSGVPTLRCVSGTCLAVAGDTSVTYAVGAADVGAALEVRVTAANAVGETTATSATTGAVPQAATTLTLTASALQIPMGGDDTLIATVAPAVNGGTVTFSDRNGHPCGPITSLSLTLGSVPTTTPPTVVPVPAKVTITSTPSEVLGTQTFVYRETGDVNTTQCWLDRVVIFCDASQVVLHNLSAGKHRFEVLVEGDDSQSYDTDVWTIRVAIATPRGLHARVVNLRATVTWNAVRGASAYVVTETSRVRAGVPGPAPTSPDSCPPSNPWKRAPRREKMARVSTSGAGGAV